MIMKTEPKKFLTPVVQQVTNNTTSWIGHRSRDNENVVTGQTFIAPSGGDLEAIEVFSSIVTKPGKVIMTLHSFDPQHKSWGPALSTSSVDINNTETGKWLAFNMPGTHLDKGQAYGFRLESHDTFIGVGEAAGSHTTPPFAAGQEWQFTKSQSKGKCFSYFSLAFKVDMRA
jgi:hypothetical protein